MYKAIRALVVAALAATSLVSVAAAPAHATAGPFACSSTFYQVSGGKMYSFDPSTGVYSLMPGTGAGLSGLNAIGYNPADQYIYGVSGAKIYRVLSDGSFDAGRTVASGSSPLTTGGDFIGPNKYLTSDANSNWVLIDLTNPAAPVGSTFTHTGTYSAFDFAYYPAGRVGYGLQGNTLYIATFNAGSGVPTSLASTTKTLASANSSLSGSWGASYVDAAGDAFFFNNTTHSLYEITAAQLATTNPLATLVATPASMSTPNDGASCNTAPSPYAPSVTTLDATGVSGSSAVLSGTISTRAGANNAIDTNNVKICWSTTADTTGGLLSNSPQCTTLPDTVAASTTTQTVTSPFNSVFTNTGAYYYYQVQATNHGGSVGFGEVKKFIAGGGAPSAVNHTVTFNVNTTDVHTGVMAQETRNARDALTLNTFGVTGYTFDHWSTDPNGVSGTTYNDGDPYDFTADVTLYAIWTPDAATSGPVTVTYDANGGSGSMAPQTSSVAAALNLNTFTRPGYTFQGWDTQPDGSGDNYADGDTYGFSAPTTLYAQWQANGYTVNFNSQGGNSFPSSGYTAGGCVDLPGTPTRDGYTFIGWFVAPDAHSILPSPYCPGNGDGNITLYAHWAPVSYVVHYNSQGGSAVGDGSYNAGDSINLAGAPSYAGHNFGGWSLSPSGASVSSPYKPASNGTITFYAIWTAASYTVTFDPNGGAPGATGSYTAGGSLPLAPAPTKAGQVFQGWFLAPTGGSALTSPYTPGNPGSITLYAQWAPATYKVSFNSQGGSSVADGKYSTSGCVDLPAAPTRDGYTFNGWFSAAEGGTALSNPYCPTGTGDLSIFAQWTKKVDPKPVTREPVTVVISGFADGSPKLTWTIKKKIDIFLKKYSDYKVIQCVGFTEGPTILKTDKALSIARATNACNYALSGLGSGLQAKPTKFGNEQVQAAELRRVEITLSDN